MVVELRDPVLEGANLSYQVTILDGKLPPEAGLASLFIDVIGMPRTPYPTWVSRAEAGAGLANI